MSGPYGSGSFGTTTFSNQPFYTTKGLIDAILRHTGHQNPANETARRLTVLEMLNNVYAKVCQSREWDWTFATQDISFAAPIQTGTVAANQGSETITGTGTSWSTNQEPDQKIIIQDFVNTIATIDSPTGLTLEGEWNGEDGTDYTYQIVKPIIRLPNTCERVVSLSIDQVGELVPIGMQELRRKQQYANTLTGPPRWFSELYRRPQDGVRKIEVFPIPDKVYNGHLDFAVQIMALTDDDTSYPLIPDRYRHILYYGGLKEFWRFQRDLSSSAAADVDYQRALIMMQGDMKLTDSRLMLEPSRNYRTRIRRRRYGIVMDRSDFSRDG